MKKDQKDKILINLWVPRKWREAIERQARHVSVERDKTVTYLMLLKECIAKEFGLSDE